MRLTKFEKRKQEILKKHQEELDALALAEHKEREKMIEPVIDKVTKVAHEEVRKILEKKSGDTGGLHIQEARSRQGYQPGAQRSVLRGIRQRGPKAHPRQELMTLSSLAVPPQMKRAAGKQAIPKCE